MVRPPLVDTTSGSRGSVVNVALRVTPHSSKEAGSRQSPATGCFPHETPSPGNNASSFKETTSGSIIRNECLANRLCRSFFNGLGATMAIQIGSRKSGIYSVDFDRSIPEFPGKLHGQHIEHRLGAVVAEALASLDRHLE
jgi:hypothetical protein